MTPKLAILALTLAALTFTLNAAPVEDTEGGYLPTQPHYAVKQHQLYAFDGSQWYVLRRPQFNGGLLAGAHYGKSERWCKVGGSHIASYARTPSTFRNQSKQPVFAQGSNF